MDKEKRKKISKIGKIIACVIFSILLVVFLIVSCIPTYAMQNYTLGASWTAPQNAGVHIMNLANKYEVPNTYYYSIPQISFEPTDIGYFPTGTICASTNWYCNVDFLSLGVIASQQYMSQTLHTRADNAMTHNNVITSYEIGMNGRNQIFGISYGNFYYFNEALSEEFEHTEPFPLFGFEVSMPDRTYYNINREFLYFPVNPDYEYTSFMDYQTGTMMICFPNDLRFSGVEGEGYQIDENVTLQSSITVQLVGTNYRETFTIDNNQDRTSDIMSHDFIYYVPSTGNEESWHSTSACYIDVSKNEDIKTWACECLGISTSAYETRPVLFYVEDVTIYYVVDNSDEYIGADPSQKYIITQTTNTYDKILMEYIAEFDNTPGIIETPPSEDSTIGNMDISSTIALTSWLGNAISGFFDTTIVAGMTIGGIFILVISFALVMWFLKIFAGG